MTTEKTALELLVQGDEAFVEAAFRSGDFDAAQELLQAARDGAAGEGDQKTEAAAMDALGLLLHYRNITKLMDGAEVDPADVAGEEELFRQALAGHQGAGDSVGAASSLFGIGLVYQVLHRDWASAMPYFWQALTAVGELEARGELYACSEIHRHVGFYYLVEDVRPTEAVRHLQLSLDLREKLGDLRRMPSALVALGEAELAAGNRERALGLLRDAVAKAHEAELLPARIADAEQVLRAAEDV